MKKSFYYIILPIASYIIFLAALYYFNNDLKSILEVSSLIIQSLAVIIGGLWAYRKFGWEKKCENIITLKAALMEYSYRHNISAAQYRQDGDVTGYKLRLLPHYNNLSSKIHLSYYVSSETRKKIFNIIWLTIGNDTGEKFDKLTDNWQKFESQLKEVYEDFEKIISY